ncbi:hypothetical protein ES703_116134 [subsurface metagenome]
MVYRPGLSGRAGRGFWLLRAVNTLYCGFGLMNLFGPVSLVIFYFFVTVEMKGQDKNQFHTYLRWLRKGPWTAFSTDLSSRTCCPNRLLDSLRFAFLVFVGFLRLLAAGRWLFLRFFADFLYRSVSKIAR